MMKYGLLGSNISYSISPEIHRYLFKYFHIDASYELLDYKKISKEEFAMISNHYAGINVTIPHKQEIMKLITKFNISATSIEINASNCIDFKQKNAFNTDFIGFLSPLKDHIKSIKKAIILGNGGAAKACFYALTHHKINTIIIERKDLDKINYSGYDLIVNATPVTPITNVTSKILYDLNYSNEKSLFLDQNFANIKIDGLEMLVVQAVESFKIWHNICVSDEIIKEIILKARNEWIH